MLNAQQLMKRANEFGTSVGDLQSQISECVETIGIVDKQALELKTALSEWSQALDTTILHNRKLVGAAASATANGGRTEAPVGNLVLDYVKTHPGATASQVMSFLGEQRQKVSTSALQYAITKLRGDKQIRARGTRGHRKYFPIEARA